MDSTLSTSPSNMVITRLCPSKQTVQRALRWPGIFREFHFSQVERTGCFLCEAPLFVFDTVHLSLWEGGHPKFIEGIAVTEMLTLTYYKRIEIRFQQKCNDRRLYPREMNQTVHSHEVIMMY